MRPAHIFLPATSHQPPPSSLRNLAVNCQPLVSRGVGTTVDVHFMTANDSVPPRCFGRPLSARLFGQWKTVVRISTTSEDSLEAAVIDNFGVPSIALGWSRQSGCENGFPVQIEKKSTASHRASAGHEKHPYLGRNGIRKIAKSKR